MKKVLILLATIAFSSMALADVQTVTGKPLPNCTATQTIEAHYKLYKVIPYDRTGSVTKNKSEPVCEFNMKMTLKADGTTCSVIPPGDVSCKFALNGKEEEVYPSFRYQTFNSDDKSDAYHFSTKGDIVIVYIDTMSTSKSSAKFDDSIEFSTALSTMPNEIKFMRNLANSNLSEDGKIKQEGIRGEVMLVHGKP